MENKGFKLIAFRSLKEVNAGQDVNHNLEYSQWYFFQGGYKDDGSGKIINDDSAKDFLYQKSKITILPNGTKKIVPSVNVNCIVGKNGSGKSTIINNILLLVNNLIYSNYYTNYNVCRNRTFLQISDNMNFELAYEGELENKEDENKGNLCIHIISCRNGLLSVDGENVPINIGDEESKIPNKGLTNQIKFTNTFIDKQPINKNDGVSFFSLFYNYSIYSNTEDFFTWIWDNNELFHNHTYVGDSDTKSKVRTSATMFFLKNIKDKDYRIPLKLSPARIINERPNRYPSNNNLIDPQTINKNNQDKLIELCLLNHSLREINKNEQGKTEIVSFIFHLVEIGHRNCYENKKTISFLDEIYKALLEKYGIKIDEINKKSFGRYKEHYAQWEEYIKVKSFEYFIEKYRKKEYSFNEENQMGDIEQFYTEHDEECKSFFKEDIKRINLEQCLNEVHKILVCFNLLSTNNSLKSYVIDRGLMSYFKPIRIDEFVKNTNGTIQYFDVKFECNEQNILKSEGNPVISGVNVYLSDLFLSPLLKAKFYIETNGKNERPLSSLSSGERQLLTIRSNFLYDLLAIDNRWNRDTEYENLETDPGIENIQYEYVNAFFDEVELYLHPEWQRKFLSNLIDGIKLIKFNHIKGINIIIATHSPFILSDVPKSNVLFLNEDGTPADKSKIGETFGANIHDLLKDGFFMESTIGEVARREIQKIVDFYYEVQDNNKKPKDERDADLESRKEENKEHFEYIGKIIGDQYYKNTINFMLDEIYDRKQTDKLDDFLKGLSEEERKALKEKL